MDQNTTFVVGLVGSVIGIVSMYLISKIASDWIIRRLRCEKSLHIAQQYIEDYKIKIVGVLFVVPVFPDIIVCIAASVMEIKLSWFGFIAIMSKTVSIGMIVYSRQLAEAFSVERWQIILIELLTINMISYFFKLKEVRKKR